MELKQILILTILSLLHLVLAGMLLSDLGNRKRVLGGKKAIWAVLIPILVFVGSLLYLLCHPKIFYGHDED